MRVLRIVVVLGASALVSRSALAAAAVSLTDASATMTQTSATSWTLAKTGTVDANSVTWEVTATESATVAGKLVVSGQMTVTNSGADGATIGNFVVNLQTRIGKSWATMSSDIADATSGDAATVAHVMAKASSEKLSLFTENAASGQLLFSDAATNAVFSLVPQVTASAICGSAGSRYCRR